MPGWDRFDVPGWFRNSFDVPVLVDNDVNIMALGEREFAWPDVDHLVFVKVATGIGSGVISGGYLQRGAQGTAGDIGHVYVARGAEVPCQCGNRGCLEALASGPAIGRALQGGRAARRDEPGCRRARQARQHRRDPGRAPGRPRHRRGAHHLREPHQPVASSSSAARSPRPASTSSPGVREVVYTRSMPLATEHLQITQSKAGPDAAVLGASMLAIHHALSPVNIEAMVVGVESVLA